MDKDMVLDRIIDETDFSGRLRRLAELMPDHPGSAVVCTAELTPKQIDDARRGRRIAVRFDGVGFALMYGWKRRKPSNVELSGR